jgi:hypothetical protein
VKQLEHFTEVMLELFAIDRLSRKCQQAILDDGFNLGGGINLGCDVGCDEEFGRDAVLLHGGEVYVIRNPQLSNCRTTRLTTE